MFEKVDELLADTGKIPTQTAFRLTLALQRETANAVNKLVEHIKIQNGRIYKLETSNQDLSNKNIINWILLNPKKATMVFFIFVVIVDILVDHFSSVDGINALLSLLKRI